MNWIRLLFASRTQNQSVGVHDEKPGAERCTVPKSPAQESKVTSTKQNGAESIRRIQQEEFRRIAPDLSEFGFPDREMEWYSSNGDNFIGKLVIDKIEQTWLGHVWFRDESGKYPKREMVGEPYKIKTDVQARQLLVGKMREFATIATRAGVEPSQETAHSDMANETADKRAESPQKEPKAKFIEHRGDGGDYTFQRPSDWIRVEPSMNLGCPVILYAESPKPSFTTYQNGQPVPIFSPTVTLVEYPRGVTAGQSLSQVFSLFQGMFPSMYAGFSLKSHGGIFLPSGREAMELRFVFRCGTTPMTAHAVMLLTDDKVLWLDGSCRSDDFPKYAETIKAVVTSIET